MKVIEGRGSHTKIGEAIGEALRDHFRARMHRPAAAPQRDAWARASLGAMEQHIPEVIEQIRGIERGAGLDAGVLLDEWIGRPRRSMFENACSNVVFGDGPDGPLWGKNNDGEACAPAAAPLPVHVVLKMYPDKGIPLINCTYAGWVAAGDIVNAEGVASGWSSGSSPFFQSPFNVPDRLWIYAGMLKARSAEDFARHITALPLRGKGYTGVTIDAQGNMFSAEIMPPLVQLRRPSPWMRGMNCTNWYQHPHLKGLCFRAHIDNAMGRSAVLEQALKHDRLDVKHMTSVLRSHGAPADICRHGQARHDCSFTEHSMIGVVRERKMLICDGNPCEATYEDICL